jgi:hypothetical protein
VQVVGAFVGLAKDEVPLIRAGLTFGTSTGSVVEVIAVADAEPSRQRVKIGNETIVTPVTSGELQKPALLRLTCLVVDEECRIAGRAVVRNATVMLPPPVDADATVGDGRLRQLRFAVDDVHPVKAGPRTEVQVVGAFVGLVNQEAALIRHGLTFGAPTGSVVEVIAVADAEPSQQRIRIGNETIVTPVTSGELQKPALLRLTCLAVDDECRIAGRAVVRNATVMLPPPVDADAAVGEGRLRQLRFSVEDVHPANAAVQFPIVRRVEPVTRVATIRARFTVRPEVMSLVKVGDVEAGGSTGSLGLTGAQLTGIDPNRETLTAVTTVIGIEQGVRRSYDVQQPVTAFTATLRVPVVLTPTGWRYRDRPIKVGVGISFETLSYFMDGWILDARFGPDATRESR